MGLERKESQGPDKQVGSCSHSTHKETRVEDNDILESSVYWHTIKDQIYWPASRHASPAHGEDADVVA